MAKLKEITLEELKSGYEVIDISENYFRHGKNLSVRNKETRAIERFFLSDEQLGRW